MPSGPPCLENITQRRFCAALPDARLVTGTKLLQGCWQILSDKGEPMSDLSSTAQRATNAISDTADKVSKAASQAGGQANEVLGDIERMISRNPLPSVIIAAVIGYVWARVRH
jgi:ElaB/YqjD/DUF883 family membrane-anchored ribosome-binding protein